jgi:hypothetical protein
LGCLPGGQASPFGQRIFLKYMILKINFKNIPCLKNQIYTLAATAIGGKPLTANSVGGKEECHVGGREFGGPFHKK